MKLQALLSILVGYSVVAAKNILVNKEVLGGQGIDFMKKYDLPEKLDVASAYTPHNTAGPVTKLQEFAGLPHTGRLDAKSENINTRRCGVKDTKVSKRNRSKRYTLGNRRWNKKFITYSIVNGALTMEKSRVEALMQSAFDVWAPHGGFRFVKVDGRADIEVSFVRLDHGDGKPFDGLGKILAHAFYPPSGVIHFDDDEIWTDDPNRHPYATDFFTVAVHEIGHALGLKHSSVKSSVMYKVYQGAARELYPDDILGIKAHYSSVWARVWKWFRSLFNIF